jgi:hypothetical protein
MTVNKNLITRYNINTGSSRFTSNTIIYGITGKSATAGIYVISGISGSSINAVKYSALTPEAQASMLDNITCLPKQGGA